MVGRFRLAFLVLVFLLKMTANDAGIDQGTNSFYGSNKLLQSTMPRKPKNPDLKRNLMKEGQTDDLIKDVTYQREPSIFADKDIEFLVSRIRKGNKPLNSDSNISKKPQDHAKSKEHRSQLASNEMRQHQQKLDKIKAQSSRQKRTIHTPDTTLICEEELSCRNKCKYPARVVYDAKLTCFCDEDCEYFIDCCADYLDFCGTNVQNTTNSTAQNTSSTENLVNVHNKYFWDTVSGVKLKGTNGIWMISSCPLNWPTDFSYFSCIHSLFKDITEDDYHYPPAYTSNGRVYLNIFCAMCNGESFMDLIEFTAISYECEFTPPRHLSPESTLSYLFSYCPKKDQELAIYWSPKKGDPRRYRLDLDPSIGCSDLERENCVRQKPGIVTSKHLYRNIHCAKCDGKRDDPISCGPNITANIYDEDHWWQGYHSPKLFTFVFELKNAISNEIKSMQLETRCPSNKVFDHYLDICRDTLPAMPRISHFYEYEVVLWMQPPVAPQGLAQVLAVPLQQIKNVEIVRNISFTLRLQKHDRLYPNLRNILDFKSPFNITYGRAVHTIFKANKRTLNCANLQIYVRSEYTVLQNESSAVFIEKTGEVLQSIDYYINSTTASISANKSQAILVCRQSQKSNCSGAYLQINEGQFRILTNKSLMILVNASKPLYGWSEYTWVEKSVLVCENLPKKYNKAKVISKKDPVLTTISIVCMSLSIIGLVFVLVTYSLFSELRTPSGINLMNLSVSILLVQVMWLLGSGQTDTPITCTNISVVLHYLILVSFVWTSIIIFDIWKGSSSENPALADCNINVARNVALGWLPALAFVSICVALDLTGTVNIGYKSKMPCWINKRWSMLYFLAVPVAIIFTFNIVFGIVTFRVIKAITPEARSALAQDTEKSFGINVRIASLMAFTWIFGFAATFGWKFLWYPFVILNGLQGVYIAMTFALSKKTTGLYKRLFKSPLSVTSEAPNVSTSNMTIEETVCHRSIADTKL